MHSLQRFFLFCSGSNESILKRAPSDVNKYAGIGATIFFTGVFACIAAGFALYSVFHNYFVSIFFGMIWGLMIFNLDRYIVSTMNKKGHFFRDFMTATPRLILAVIIAIVIAKPLELKIFQSEIHAELIAMEQEKFKTQEALVAERFEPQIEVLNGEIAGLKEEITEKELVRNNLESEAIAEADGTGGSMRRNLGPIYRTKRAAADKAEEELAAVLATNTPIINDKLTQITELQTQAKDEIASLERMPLNGFAAQLEALSRVARESNAIFIASIFIMLLFIAIETAPIFVKLITPRSPYEYVLDKHEYQFAMNHKERTSLLKNVTTNKIQFDTDTGQYKTRLAVKAEKEIAEKLIQEEIEKVKGQPLSWRELLKKGNLFGAG